MFSSFQPCIEARRFNTGFFPVLLCAIIGILSVLVPVAVMADELFDFQMKLAQQGNAEAQYKVGEMYETGFGVKQDRAEAEKWINKAAGQGNETAKFKLLYWDLEKNGLNDKNKAEMNQLMDKAKKGDEQAQYYTGKMYAHGVGMKKDLDTAIDWLGKSALVGNLGAERELTAARDEKKRIALKEQQRIKQQQDELKRQQELEKQQQLEQQRKLEARKQAEARARAEQAARKKQAAEEAARKKKIEQERAAIKARLLEQQKAEQAQRQQKQQKQQKEQAILEQREQQKEERERQFESDPCSGKSARFLSTCR